MSQMSLIRETIRHNSWATLRLIEHLQSLAPETVELSAAGTYGSIGSTLSHLVRAERAYLARLNGEVPQPGQPAPFAVDDLLAESQRLARDWDQLLETGLDGATTVSTMRGTQTAATILAQAINHGAEHRADVCTVLGAHGLEPPALDPFAYGQTIAREQFGTKVLGLDRCANLAMRPTTSAYRQQPWAPSQSAYLARLFSRGLGSWKGERLFDLLFSMLQRPFAAHIIRPLLRQSHAPRA